jgi:hypothetical protein
MGGFSPVPLDPLPQPEKPQVDSRPAPDVSQRQGFQGYPPEAGWTGKGGQGLNVVSNFLSGWMAGKHIQEQKKQKAAIDEVGHYQTDYQNSMMIYQNLVNNPDAKQEEKAKAREDVLRNWKELHAVQRKYLIGDDGGKEGQKKQGVGGKIKSGAKKAFMADTPHMFAAGAIDLADKMDPTQAISADPKAQEAAFRFGEEKKAAAQRDEYSKLLRKPNKTSEEMKQLENMEDDLFGPGSADKAAVAKTQRAEMDRDLADTNAAREKYKRGEKLNEREEQLLVKGGELRNKDIKTPFEAYASDVGSGKRFSSYSQAADAYFKKEIDITRASRNPSMWEEMQQAGKAVLGETFAKDDQDTTKPHKYRITIGGKTEERMLTDEQVAAAQKQDKNLKASKVPRIPTKGEVNDWVVERMKPSPEEKEDAKKKPAKPLTPAQVNQVLSPVLATVIQDNPNWQRFVAKRPVPGGIGMTINPYQQSMVGFFERTATVRKNYEDFKQAVQNEMIRRGQGDLAMQVLPGEAEQPQAMDAPPAE